MSKQDRQAVRTPTALEQKYNFGRTFSETNKSDAKRDAQIASLSQTLSQYMSDTNTTLESLKPTKHTIGTSGIWTYRKWESGIAECWAVSASKLDKLTFPVTFESDPCVQFTEYNSKFHYFVIGKIKVEEGGE